MSTAIHELPFSRPAKSVSYCERIICLHAPGQEPSWWKQLLDFDETPFAPALRLREAPLADAYASVAEAVAEGYRPHVCVPGPSIWVQVAEDLDVYRHFAKLWIGGRDDETISRLLAEPSDEVRAAQVQGHKLIVPDPAYGEALDQWLITRLEDFQKDPEAVPAPTKLSQETGVYVSRLNPFRVLEVNLDRMVGEVTLHQWYVTADPDGQREPCEIAVALPNGSTLVFDQGLSQLDLKLIPDLAYGKALDQWLITRLDDFQEDPEALPAPTSPWQKTGVYVSRLNPFRLLEVNLERIAGEVTLHQWYVTAEPDGPREPCKIAVALPDGSSLVFDQQGLCQLDLNHAAEVKAVCDWLGVRPLVTVGRPDIGRIARIGDAMKGNKDQLLDQLQRSGKKHDFLAWLRALLEGYPAGESRQPGGVKPIESIARAWGEVIQEFQLTTLLPVRAPALPTLGAGAMRGAGGMRPRGFTLGADDPEELEKRLVDVALAFTQADEASDQPSQT